MEVPARGRRRRHETSRVKVGDKVSQARSCRVEPGGVSTEAQSRRRASTRNGDKTRRTNRRAPRAEHNAGTRGRRRDRAAATAARRRSRDRDATVAQRRRCGRSGRHVHASPAIRRFARELGVDLRRVTRQRTERPRHARGRARLRQARAAAQAAARAGPAFAGLPPWPKVDFAQYGEIERKPLSRIRKLSGPNLHRNWVQIPHITQLRRSRRHVDSKRFATRSTRSSKAGGASSRCSRFSSRPWVAALQRFPTSTRRSTARSWSQALLQHRLRRRHAQRARRPGAQGRRRARA